MLRKINTTPKGPLQGNGMDAISKIPRKTDTKRNLTITFGVNVLIITKPFKSFHLKGAFRLKSGIHKGTFQR